MRLENMKAGRKGNLNVATEVCDCELLFSWCFDFGIGFLWLFMFAYCQIGFSSGTFSSYGWGAKSKRGHFGVS